MPKSIFNGAIGTSPKNPIIYSSLKYVYDIKDMSIFMNKYHLLCENLYDTVMNNTYDFKIKLFKEYYNTVGESAKTLNDNNDIIFIHYYKYKIIPKNINNDNNDNDIIDIGTSNIPVKIISLHKSFNNPIITLKTNGYNDDFTFEFCYNHLIVKRKDCPYGWGHPHKIHITESK